MTNIYHIDHQISPSWALGRDQKPHLPFIPYYGDTRIFKHHLWAVKDSCHVTLVNDDVETTAHKVILIELSPFIRL